MLLMLQCQDECGEPDARGDVLDRVEVRDGPLIAQHAGEAHDAVDGGGAKGVGERVGAE